MEQDTKKQYTVNGYLFGDLADVEIANQELSKIEYIDKKIEEIQEAQLLFNPSRRKVDDVVENRDDFDEENNW